jgi:hypothetical protein
MCPRAEEQQLNGAKEDSTSTAAISDAEFRSGSDVNRRSAAVFRGDRNIPSAKLEASLDISIGNVNSGYFREI